MNEWFGILITLILSAFFSGMEIAFVSSNKIRLELDKKKKGVTSLILNIFYKNKENLISTLLVGNNIALVVYGILMARILEPPIAQVLNNQTFIVISQTIISTLLILLVAEFLPKTIFRINPNFSLKIFALPLYIFYLILFPVSKLSTMFSNGLLRLLGVKKDMRRETSTLTKVDLDFFVQQSIDDASDNSEMDTEVIIFQNALDFSKLRLRDCMVPRNELVATDYNTSLDVLMNLFIETGRSKILIYKESIDNIVGYIHSSEMFKQPDDWRLLIKQMPIVPETMAGNKLMQQLMKQNKSIAVVVDEFGGTAGIVTLEDLVEEIFGDFEDEHDKDSYIAKQISDDEFEFSGRIEIEKINEHFNLNIPESDEYVTLAGYILFHYHNIPALNEIVEIDKFEFKMIRISAAKIELVRVKLLK